MCFNEQLDDPHYLFSWVYTEKEEFKDYASTKGGLFEVKSWFLEMTFRIYFWGSFLSWAYTWNYKSEFPAHILC